MDTDIFDSWEALDAWITTLHERDLDDWQDWETSAVIGAYWGLSHGHGGQDSDSYRALCAIGALYQPGAREAGPDSGDSDACDAYHATLLLCGAHVTGYTGCPCGEIIITPAVFCDACIEEGLSWHDAQQTCRDVDED